MTRTFHRRVALGAVAASLRQSGASAGLAAPARQDHRRGRRAPRPAPALGGVARRPPRRGAARRQRVGRRRIGSDCRAGVGAGGARAALAPRIGLHRRSVRRRRHRLGCVGGAERPDARGRARRGLRRGRARGGCGPVPACPRGRSRCAARGSRLAARGSRLADGSRIGGSVVRVKRLWPARPDRLHVLLGAGRDAPLRPRATAGPRPARRRTSAPPWDTKRPGGAGGRRACAVLAPGGRRARTVWAAPARRARPPRRTSGTGSRRRGSGAPRRTSPPLTSAGRTSRGPPLGRRRRSCNGGTCGRKIPRGSGTSNQRRDTAGRPVWCQTAAPEAT
jgi:hypothetical protein